MRRLGFVIAVCAACCRAIRSFGGHLAIALWRVRSSSRMSARLPPIPSLIEGRKRVRIGSRLDDARFVGEGCGIGHFRFVVENVGASDHMVALVYGSIYMLKPRNPYGNRGSEVQLGVVVAESTEISTGYLNLSKSGWSFHASMV